MRPIQKPKYQNSLGYSYLPIALLVYIVGDMILKDMGVEICQSSGCSIASATLYIDSFYLNLMGVGFALSLIITSSFRKISNFFLYAGILFETLMIGYQFFVSGAICYYCLGIYAIVWFIAIIRFKLLIPITSIIVVTIAFGMLKFVVLSNDISTNIENNTTTTYLFGSTSCMHCSEMKSYLNEKNISYEFKNIKDINNQYILQFFKLSSIPVLVVQTDEEIKLLLTKKSIKEYFGDNKIPTRPTFDLNSMMQQSIIPIDSNHTGGCKIDLPCMDK